MTKVALHFRQFRLAGKLFTPRSGEATAPGEFGVGRLVCLLPAGIENDRPGIMPSNSGSDAPWVKKPNS